MNHPLSSSPHPSMHRFVHLRVHSAYSLAEGAITVKNIVKICQKMNYPAVGLVDTSNLFGSLEFAMACCEAGVQPIVGAQMYLQTDPTHLPSIRRGTPDKMILIAQSQKGWTHLMALVTEAFLKTPPGEKPQVSLESLETHAEGLIALTGAHEGRLARLIENNQTDEAREHLIYLQKIFGDRLYIELMRTGLALQESIEPTLLDFAYEYGVPLVATNDVYFDKPERHEAHDALLCIAQGCVVNEADRRTVSAEHFFKSPKEMMALFADIPEAIQNTLHIAKRCHFMPKPRKPILPPFPTESGRSEEEELREKSFIGLEERLETHVYTVNMPSEEREKKRHLYFERLEYELNIINHMGFPGYFLIVSDFIQWSKSQGIPVGPGRGSGAGSLVAWALTITDIDPMRFTLLFERFLNPERVSMPDFDVDFCQDRRDEVIKYVCQKYGSPRVAHIITFGKLQARAVLRDVGRVLQMPYGQVDKICKLIPNNPADPVTLQEALEREPQLKEAEKSDSSVAKLIEIGMQLEGLYRHASTHAAGVVIGDRPLHHLVPLYKDERSELFVTQYNMKYVEMAGLVKFDFLGLKTLTVIEKCCEMVRQRGISINISHIPLDDPQTFDLLCRVETVGIFQLESAGMRDVLRKLRPDRFEDLIALVALYRPGPMDDIPRYLACKHGEEEVTYLHPLLEPILEATYGVMVYQEQVMQIAQVLGGYTLGAADLLRRAMGKKIKSEMDAQRAKFVDGAKANGIDEEIASLIFDQMAKFAGYGFNKSHSAPYALLAYQTAYLKANYPLEFFAASMTYDMNNTDKLNIYRQDMTQLGFPLLPPDINASYPTFSVEEGRAVRYGLAAVKSIGEQAMAEIVKERKVGGPFKSLEDLTQRLDPQYLNKRIMEHLVAAGCFDSLRSNRRQIFEGIEVIGRYAQLAKVERTSSQENLFSFAQDKAIPPLTLPDVRDWGPMERLQHEFQALGFYMSAHPLDVWAESLSRIGMISSSQLLDLSDGATVQMAGVVIAKKERTSKKSGKPFAFVQLSDMEGLFEITLFSDTLATCREKLEPGTPLCITGLFQSEGEEGYRMICQGLQPLEEAMQQKIKNVRIVLQESTCPEKIKDIIEELKPGVVHLCLDIQLSQSPNVLIRFPKPYDISSDVRAKFIGLEGFIRIEESMPRRE